MTSPRLSAPEWLARVMTAQAGAELLDWIIRRIGRPYDEGPMLDSREGEEPDGVFEHLATEDELFRARLDATASMYFAGPMSNPEIDSSIPVIHALLGLVQRRALSGAHASIRGWLAQHDRFLRDEPGAYTARAALGALATTQPRGIDDMRQFWLRLWQNGPELWQPRAFIGLRLQDPVTAANEIPELIRRTEAEKQDPGALLHGLWNQPGGKEAFLQWLRIHQGESAAETARNALQKRLPNERIPVFSPNRRRKAPPELPTLAPAQQYNWYH